KRMPGPDARPLVKRPLILRPPRQVKSALGSKDWKEGKKKSRDYPFSGRWRTRRTKNCNPGPFSGRWTMRKRTGFKQSHFNGRGRERKKRNSRPNRKEPTMVTPQ